MFEQLLNTISNFKITADSLNSTLLEILFKLLLNPGHDIDKEE